MKKTLFILFIVLSMTTLSACDFSFSVGDDDLEVSNEYVEDADESDDYVIEDDIIDEEYIQEDESSELTFADYIDEMYTYPTESADFDTVAIVVPGVVSPCAVDADGPCGFDLNILASAQWATDTAEFQKFYFEVPTAVGVPEYYGPFYGNVATVVAQANNYSL